MALTNSCVTVLVPGCDSSLHSTMTTKQEIKLQSVTIGCNLKREREEKVLTKLKMLLYPP